MKFKITCWDPSDKGLIDIFVAADENNIIDLPDNTYEFFEVLNQYTDTVKRWGRFKVNFNSSHPEICFMNKHDDNY